MFWRSRRRSPIAPVRAVPSRVRLGLEFLEDRTVPSLTVALVEAESSPTDPLVLDVVSKLQGTGFFSTVDVIDARATTPTLATLQTYNSVLVWSDNSFNDKVSLGNNLADYVDGGGGVVVAVFANSDPGGLDLGGRWTSGGYDALTVAIQSQGTRLTLGTVALPNHPIMSGVTSFDGGTSSFNDPGSLATGATLIASYSNGTPLVAAQTGFAGKVVTLNFWPPSSGARADLWDPTTQGALLMGNSLGYAATAAPTLTAVSPNSGLTTGGTAVTITGTNFLSVTGVRFGGVAASGFTVNSNTSITATAPAGTGTVDVTVTTQFAGTTATSAADLFTYTSMPPAPQTGTVSGTVFTDVAFTGVRPQSAGGLAGYTVFVDANGNGALGTGELSTTTDANGSFAFTGLAPGSYRLVVLPGSASERFTLPTGGTAEVVVGAGQTATQDFGAFSFGLAGVVPSTANLFGTGNADANIAYVRGLYHAVLGRDGGGVIQRGGQAVSEATFWASRLASGELTREQVASSVINSAEHRAQQVSYFYRTLLGRDVDNAAGGWVAFLTVGGTEAQVVLGIIGSNEYQAAHSGNAAFVRDVYFEALGREPTAKEMASGTAQLAAGATRGAFAAGVINSDESIHRQVTGFYAAFFHRTPDSGASGWEDKLRRGESASQVQAKLIADSSAQEFFGNAKSSVVA